MTANNLQQIQELAKCGNQEILMYEKAVKHDIKSFSKVENEYSFEFKTTNTLESTHRYVFKRRLKTLNFQESTILITANFLDKEFKLYETRKYNLHHHLVFMYNDRMLEFNMKDISEWMMRECPNPKSTQVRNKKCQDGSVARYMEYVYYIPSSVPRSCENYISNESFRDAIYREWTNPSNSPDAKPSTTSVLQVASISPYF